MIGAIGTEFFLIPNHKKLTPYQKKLGPYQKKLSPYRSDHIFRPYNSGANHLISTYVNRVYYFGYVYLKIPPARLRKQA